MKMRVVKLEMHGTGLSDGWKSSTRRERLPSNWSELRGIVMQNALYRCEATMKDGSRCTDKGTDVDHIEPGDNHDLSNLQLLCKWHHNKKSSQEGNKARPRYSEKRPTPPHPGLTPL